jgi:hypothetical protein
MVEIPDNIKGYLKQVQKYHFWLLTLLMPLVLVPLAFTADARLLNDINTRSSAVKAKVESIESVTRKNAEGLEGFGHPQSDWAELITRSNNTLREQILSEWTYLWDQQKAIRTWPAPADIGADFLRAISRLKPDQELPARFRDRYLQRIRRVVQKLPSRIDAKESMEALGGDSGFGRGDFGMSPEMGITDEDTDNRVVWNATDQNELFQTFYWASTPSTKQVLLAQEELWAYEILCDAVAKANNDSTGSHNATIPYISQLAVGYRAAEEDPGGRKGGRLKTKSAGFDDYMEMDMDMDMGMDGEMMGKPANPRFANVGGDGMQDVMYDEFTGMPIDSASEDSDEALLNWIYVDSEGTPLESELVAESPDTKFVHYIPFCLKCRVDQRKLDLLLRSFATMLVPIDVRQVRVNPGSADSMYGEEGMNGGEMMSGMGSDAMSTDSVRRYDFNVELRGAIALAQKPDATVLGLNTESQE